jgi:hypothetical protein
VGVEEENQENEEQPARLNPARIIASVVVRFV